MFGINNFKLNTVYSILKRTSNSKWNNCNFSFSNFCEKVQPKPIEEKEKILSYEPERRYSIQILKKIMMEIESIASSNRSNSYQIREVKFLVPNNMKTISIYRARASIPHQYLKSNIEIPGVMTMTLITALNYFNLIFPSLYLFPYLCLVTFASYTKLLWRHQYLESVIYEINLLSEISVLITYINGHSEEVLIEKIAITSKMRDMLILSEKKPPGRNTNTPVEIRINGKKSAFLLLNEENDQGQIVNLELLMAIVTKNTKRLI